MSKEQAMAEVIDELIEAVRVLAHLVYGPDKGEAGRLILKVEKLRAMFSDIEEA